MRSSWLLRATIAALAVSAKAVGASAARNLESGAVIAGRTQITVG